MGHKATGNRATASGARIAQGAGEMKGKGHIPARIMCGLVMVTYSVVRSRMKRPANGQDVFLPVLCLRCNARCAAQLLKNGTMAECALLGTLGQR